MKDFPQELGICGEHMDLGISMVGSWNIHSRILGHLANTIPSYSGDRKKGRSPLDIALLPLSYYRFLQHPGQRGATPQPSPELELFNNDMGEITFTSMDNKSTWALSGSNRSLTAAVYLSTLATLPVQADTGERVCV